MRFARHLFRTAVFALAVVSSTGCAGRLAPATIFNDASKFDYLATCAPQSTPYGQAIRAEYLGKGEDRLHLTCGIIEATATCASGQVARVAMIASEVKAVFEGNRGRDGAWYIPVEPTGTAINLYRTCAASEPTVTSTSPSVLEDLMNQF